MPQPEITRYTNRAQDFTPITELQTNQFSFASLTYPEDMNNLSHAMLFNINVQRTSNDFSGGREQADTTFDPILNNTFGLGTTRSQQAAPPGSPGLTRRTRRALRAISMYVPETVVFEDRQQYDTPSLTQTLGIAGTAAATAGSAALAATENPGGVLAGAVGAIGVGAIAAGILGALPGASAVGSQLSGLNQRVTNTVRSTTQLGGYALNPVIEVLYNSPTLRSFNFDFIFTPKSSSEADMVWSIIYEFRRHSAPEYTNFLEGLFFLPPSDFDISFLRRDSSGSFIENTNIPRISSCVLKSVQVDYAASGQFSTFVDGMPIQIRMRLEFQELNILTRDRIDKGY